MPTIGSTEIIIIAIVILVLFGGKRIPEFVRSMGDAVREFKKAVKDDEKQKSE
jgi:sec-independent protein translocase protein TatA